MNRQEAEFTPAAAAWLATSVCSVYSVVSSSFTRILRVPWSLTRFCSLWLLRFRICFGFRVSSFGAAGLRAPCWQLTLLLVSLSSGLVRARDSGPAQPSRAAKARAAYENALSRFHQEPQSTEAAWQFARTCFDLADFAANKAQRARIARQGIAAGRHAAALNPNSAPAHYYIGMDMGQLARTKTFGALRLVRLMRTQFEKARSLDENFDDAGPDRNLGLLYRDAPSFLSIGNRAKARRHLERAVALAPVYPENRLDLIGSLLKWGKRKEARHELQLLEATWPEAHKKFAGPRWAASWSDWNRRLEQDQQRLNPQ